MATMKPGNYSKARTTLLTTPPKPKNAATVPVLQAQSVAAGSQLLGAPAFAKVKTVTTTV